MAGPGRLHAPLLLAPRLHLRNTGSDRWSGNRLLSATIRGDSLTFLALGPGAVAGVSQSYSMPRLGPATYAITANCELVTVVVVGAIALGEKLTPTHALGGGLILAGILMRGWAHRAARY